MIAFGKSGAQCIHIENA